MKPSYNNQMQEFMHRDDFQGRLDYFYTRYIDYYPTGKLAM
jgi:hypothetical protein